ncbi:site-specific integrase, partial [Nostoc sp. 2RC]|nr:site-specific integrase [Nostoc sp. 2RC]
MENLPVLSVESLAVEVVTLPLDEARVALVDYYFPNRQKINSTQQLIELWVHSVTIKSDQTRRAYRQIG